MPTNLHSSGVYRALERLTLEAASRTDSVLPRSRSTVNGHCGLQNSTSQSVVLTAAGPEGGWTSFTGAVRELDDLQASGQDLSETCLIGPVGGFPSWRRSFGSSASKLGTGVSDIESASINSAFCSEMRPLRVIIHSIVCLLAVVLAVSSVEASQNHGRSDLSWVVVNIVNDTILTNSGFSRPDHIIDPLCDYSDMIPTPFCELGASGELVEARANACSVVVPAGMVGTSGCNVFETLFGGRTCIALATPAVYLNNAELIEQMLRIAYNPCRYGVHFEGDERLLSGDAVVRTREDIGHNCEEGELDIVVVLYILEMPLKREVGSLPVSPQFFPLVERRVSPPREYRE